MTKVDGPVATAKASGDPGRLRKHSLVIAGHRTSISLEDVFWEALAEAAWRQGESVTGLVTAIDASRAGNLSSAIRVHILTELTERLRAIETPAGPPPSPR